MMQYRWNQLAIFRRVISSDQILEETKFSIYVCDGPCQAVFDVALEMAADADLVLIAMGTGWQVHQGGFDEPVILAGWEQLHAIMQYQVGFSRVLIMPEKSALSKLVETARDMDSAGEIA